MRSAATLTADFLREKELKMAKYLILLHRMMRDVLFEAAASADLGPTKEERHLLPGTSARPGDVIIRRWMNGKDGAIDVPVTGPLSLSNVDEAAAQAGAALEKACKRKVRETPELVNEKASFSCLLLWKLLAACIKEPSLKSS